MSNAELTTVLFVLLALVGAAQVLGYFFVRIRQPRVIGEIAAGVLLGPALLGRIHIQGHSFASMSTQHNTILTFVYWLGLLLLMFLSGAETRQLFSRDERRQVSLLTFVGTGVPFVLALAAGPWIASTTLAGPKSNKLSLIIIVAVAVAVTSVPVISKIFADLKILHTRFARLVLGVAVLEDIVLWAALAVATALATNKPLNPEPMAYHLAATIGFFALGF